jgi:hypothetical protein
MGSVLPVAAVLVATVLATPAAVGGRGRVLVHFSADKEAERWFASALEQKLLQELSTFQRVNLVDAPTAEECAGREASCWVKAYAHAADVVVLGILKEDRLRYQLYETAIRSLATEGSIYVGPDAYAGRLQHQLGGIVRDIVRSGGILDQQAAALDPPSESEATQPPARQVGPSVEAESVGPVPEGQGVTQVRTEETPPSLPSTPTSLPLPDVATASAETPRTLFGFPVTLWLLGGLMGLMAIPLFIGLWLAGRRGLRSARFPVLVLLGFGALLVAQTMPETRQAWELARGYLAHPGAGLAFNLLGGMLWAAFGLSNLAYVFSPLSGIGRIHPGALWPLLRAWGVSAAMRSCVLVLYLPVAVAVLLAGRTIELSSRTLWTLAMPAAGLFAAFWFLSLMATLAPYVDLMRVQGLANTENRWHVAIRRYVRGYIRRSGADLGLELLSSILFLPGKDEGVISYGGGLTAPRIVIGEKLLELALGPLPEEPESADPSVNPQELAQGMLLPDVQPKKPNAAQRRAERQQRARRVMARATPHERSHAPRALGEAATSLGWVMPAPRDKTLPLISDTREDYEAIHSLLTEHYAAFEKDFYDEDDDSDPSQKDFLFGAVLREIGALRRGDGVLKTLRFAYSDKVLERPRLARLSQRLGDFFRRIFSRPLAVIADSYAALNYGRDHLIQYYAYLRDPNHPQLTVRADAMSLFRTSRDILDQIASTPASGEDLQLFRATLRNRLISLSQFFYTPVEELRARVVRVFTGLAALGAVALLVIISILGAVEYHPLYLQRMREMQLRAAETNSGVVDGGSP